MKLAIEHQTTRIDSNSSYIFGREKFAENLKNIFENSDNGFVFAIDATWGAGKTSFIHQLMHDLKESDKLIPIYYDAFANDFTNDTFLSIGAAIFREIELHFKSQNNQLKSKEQLTHLKDVTKKMAIELVKLGSNLAVKTLTAGVLDNSEIKEVALNFFNSTTFGTLEIDFEKKFEAHENARKNIRDYISALESISKNDEKIIFFIDELDRCRPDFAVEVLEKIKHLFSARNVIFVISYNKSQLSKIISNVYGVESVDSLKYLEKFIHIEVSLPNPDVNNKISYEYLFDEFIQEFNIKLIIKEESLIKLKKMFVSLCDCNYLSMNCREIERAFSYVSFCAATLPENKQRSLFEYFLPAAMIKVKDHELFNRLRNGKFYKPLSGNDNHPWVHDFFKDFYRDSLHSSASNVYHVKLFEDACDIVSMFKFPTDDVLDENITKT